MKAVVWEGVGDIRLEDVPEPKIKQSTDAIVRLTASAICGTDLHFIRGTIVGVDSTTAHAGPPADVAEGMKEEFRRELKKIAPEQHAGGDNWHPGEAPFGWLEEKSPGKGINWNYSVDGRLALHSGAIGTVEWDELV
jgi:hypothetical protein